MSDFDRDIDLKGQEQLKQLSDFLSKTYSQVDFQVCCSTARRTKSSLESIKSVVHVKTASFHNELYLPSQSSLLKFIWQLEQHSKDVMIVSHNNGISDLAVYFTGHEMSLSTCGMVVINFEELEDLKETSRGLGVIEQEFVYTPT